MSADMLRADRRLRLQTMVALAMATLLAVAVVVLFKHWLEGVASTSGTSMLLLQLRRTIGLATIGCAVCLLLLAWFSASKAFKAKSVEQWPLPGARVIKDTAVRRGAAAQRIANQLLAVAFFLVLMAFAAGFVSWRLISAS